MEAAVLGFARCAESFFDVIVEVDELTVYTTALSAGDIGGLCHIDTFGKCP